MTAPTAIQMTDGSEINVAEGTCEGCGQPMADHSCGGSGGGTPIRVTTRSTGPRKAVSAHPVCPHCGGRIHFNMGGTAINAECLNRQYSLDTGDMSNPNDRLPVLTVERMGDIFEWSKTLATPPTYGKMDSAAGGAGTYSGLRLRTGRKKKISPAAPGAQIQDMAEGEAIDANEGPAKPKKTRKGKAKIVPNPEMDALAEGDSGTNPLADAEELAVVVPEPVAESAEVNDEEKARADRAARRAERKKLLAGKV